MEVVAELLLDCSHMLVGHRLCAVRWLHVVDALVVQALQNVARKVLEQRRERCGREAPRTRRVQREAAAGTRGEIDHRVERVMNRGA